MEVLNIQLKTQSLIFLILLTADIDSKIKHNYYWRDYDGTIPKDAINVTGCLYIAQVYHEGILPGTLYHSVKEAVTECRGQKITVKYPIKILCDRRHDNFMWEQININCLTEGNLQDKVIGGYEVGYKLYIGRIFHEYEWKIGKVFPPTRKAFKGLTIWKNNGKSHVVYDFEILTYLGKPVNKAC